MSKDNLVINGVDGRSGSYLLPPFDVSQLARMALSERLPPAEVDELQIKVTQDLDYPVKEGVDPDDLAQAGWAVVFPFARKGSAAARRQAAVREALAPLLAHRRAQATRRDERRYRECAGADAYRPGETKQQFLARMGAGPGPVDPDDFPYYLLLVASPEEIPYRVQYQLDVQYAVGRIHFDTADEYARYAANVVEAERQPRPGARTAAFFGVENPGDRATRASARYLTEPLADFIARDAAGAGWQVRRFLAADATKAQLARLLGDESPAILFTASHGVGFPSGDPLQRACQGAFLCQDWAGPRAGTISPEHYFAADDLAGDADLRGLITFHFACFGAGTPRHDDFVRQALGQVEPVHIAPQPFLARLPQRMLGHARGALACIGHVDRAWGSSFLQADPRHSGGVIAQRAVFESALKRLMEGRRAGHAMDFFDLRYAEMASDLTTRIEGIQRYDEHCSEEELARLWLHASDARNYAVIGDPAVRVPGDAEPCAGRDGAATASARAQPTAIRTDGEGAQPGELAQLAREVARALRQHMSSGFAIEVETSAGREGAAATGAGSARPRAYTRFAIDGSTIVRVPVGEDGAIDEVLWRIHDSAVARAQQHTSELLKLVLSLLPS